MMNRRRVIKGLTLGSGLLLVPGWLSFQVNKKPVQIVIIGDQSTLFLNNFCDQRTELRYTYIGHKAYSPYTSETANRRIVDCDFSEFIENKDPISKMTSTINEYIRRFAMRDSRFVLVSCLNKPNTLFSKLLIRCAQDQGIDFRFLGVTALLHASLTSRAKSEFMEFEQDSRISLFDVDGYLGKLREVDGNVGFTDAIEMLDKELSGVLNGYL